MLLKGLCTFLYLTSGQILFDPAVFVEHGITIDILIQFVYVVFPVIACQMPAIWIKGELLQVFRKLFDLLGYDKAPQPFSTYCFVIELTVCF